ncbi:hypothetical protein [Nocardioides daejeonensis]|uniref:hypothetical protein n=1 Tax=Nocardioides daejeonensis TaxID=1046556 RepID=UPI000D7427BB|nr:hypothetical protein [Nocardioides daejeonensis]
MWISAWARHLQGPFLALTACCLAATTVGAAPVAADPPDLSRDVVQRLLQSDPTARLDAAGRLFFADRHTARLVGPEAPARAVAPLNETFSLHSRPRSKRVLYLDFDGERVCNTGWNRGDGGILGGLLTPTLPCGDYEGFKGATSHRLPSADLKAIQEVWARVSEDFAPFDIDVTTQRPKHSAIERAGSGDDRFGVHAVVTASTRARNATCGGPGCAGVAYVGVFPDAHANDQRILWAFSEEIGNNPRRLADVLSHEAGHTLGLLHDGGGGDGEYYGGHGIWGPIMGSGDRHLTQWSRGEYAGASQRQDDLAVIAKHGVQRIRDDHADGRRGASRLKRGQTAHGVITSSTDTDAFTLRTTCRSRVVLRARNAALGPNLDIRMTIRRPGARRAQVIDPLSSASGKAGGLDATWRGKARPGTWLVTLAGTGARDPGSTGYSRYGSLGQFTLKASGRCVRR